MHELRLMRLRHLVARSLQEAVDQVDLSIAVRLELRIGCSPSRIPQLFDFDLGLLVDFSFQNPMLPFSSFDIET